MSTRSYVFTATDKGYRGVYVHSDGYLEGVGAVLQRYYNTEQAVNRIIELGNLSVLGKSLATCEAVKRFDFGFHGIFCSEFLALPSKEQTRLKKEYCSWQYTVAYHRDCSEELEFAEYPDMSALMNDLKQGYEMIAYIYLSQDGKWFYLNRDNYKWCHLAPETERIIKQNGLMELD